MKKRIALLIAVCFALSIMAAPTVALAGSKHVQISMNQPVTDHLETYGQHMVAAYPNHYYITAPGEGTLHIKFDHNSDINYWQIAIFERKTGGDALIKSERAKTKGNCPFTIDVPVKYAGYMINISESPYNVSDKPHEEPYTFTCTFTPKSAVPVTGVKLNRTSYTLEKNKKMQLKATVLPSSASDKSITWHSGNTKVAVVDSTGKVTGKSNGSAVITATTSNGKTASCKISVRTSAKSVKLNYTGKVLKVKKALQLKATLSPAGTYPKSVTWVSKNPAIASVDKTGKVKAKKAGTTYIYAKAWNGIYAKCKIVVKK